MYVIIEQVLDGSWDSVDLIGAYEDKVQASKAMQERSKAVINDYLEWRGIDGFNENDKPYCCDEEDFCSRGFDGEGEVLRWFVFDTDNPTTSYRV